jgi:uncharacterized membrane protein
MKNERLEAFSDGVIAILITIMDHHHMFQAIDRVNGKILWANMHLLFWLSLVPFVTGWMGENHFAPLPTAVYGGVLILAAIAYTILVTALLAEHGPNSRLARARSGAT